MHCMCKYVLYVPVCVYCMYVCVCAWVSVCVRPMPVGQRYSLVPYVVEIDDGYPPIPCPGKVGVATETTGVAND